MRVRGVRGRRQGAGRRSRGSLEHGVHTYASLESTFGVSVLILSFSVYSKKIPQRTDSSVEKRFRAKSSSDSMSRFFFSL